MNFIFVNFKNLGGKKRGKREREGGGRGWRWCLFCVIELEANPKRDLRNKSIKEIHLAQGIKTTDFYFLLLHGEKSLEF